MTIKELLRALKKLAKCLSIKQPKLIKNGNTKHRTLLFNQKIALIGIHKGQVPEGTLNGILETLGLKKYYLDKCTSSVKSKIKKLFKKGLSEPVSEVILDQIFKGEDNDD